MKRCYWIAEIQEDCRRLASVEPGEYERPLGEKETPLEEKAMKVGEKVNFVGEKNLFIQTARRCACPEGITLRHAGTSVLIKDDTFDE